MGAGGVVHAAHLSGVAAGGERDEERGVGAVRGERKRADARRRRADGRTADAIARGVRDDEAGDRIARLCALAEPILGALQIELHIVALLLWPVRADFLDELPVARAAAIGHDNTEDRVVLRPDTLHADFDCHKILSRYSPGVATATPQAAFFSQKGAQTLVTHDTLCKSSFRSSRLNFFAVTGIF